MIRHHSSPGVPFGRAEDAWLWTCRSHTAAACGLHIRRSADPVRRPCEPADVVHAVDRLYRNRQLTREHLAVLGHYGRRQSAPDPARDREARASFLWEEAFGVIGPVLVSRGIVFIDGVMDADATAEAVPV